jgi:hypothetical protein
VLGTWWWIGGAPVYEGYSILDLLQQQQHPSA